MTGTQRWVVAPLAALAALLAFSSSPAAAFVGSNTQLGADRGQHEGSDTGPLPLVTHGATTPNWAGYVVLGQPGQFDNVKASWTVPEISCAPDENSVSIIWVGIDGAGTRTVEQIGTEQSCYSGHAVYRTFFEMFPNPPQFAPGFNVQPGDEINASVQVQDGDTFKLSISAQGDEHEGSFHTFQTAPIPAARATGEVILEVPYGAPSPNITRVDFNDAAINHTILEKTNPIPVVMVNATGHAVYIPTVIDEGRFSVVHL